MISTERTSCCGVPNPGRVVQIFYGILLLWTKEMHGLSDFSNFLFRIISSHSARACDGERVSLSCPRHSTITVQSAFYGTRAGTCSTTTALQKMLSECQDRRLCQLRIHPHLFGRDPCPGTPKYLHVSYSCKPAEHKNRTRCEGDKMSLHCKYPKVLNIYSAVYGRELGEREICLTGKERPPPYECLYHGAIDAVTRECYGKQRCVFSVGDQQFRNPCAPGTKKYLTVLYACVPQTLLKEADPNLFKTTSVPHETTMAGDLRQVRDSRLLEMNGIIVSNSLMAYGYIKVCCRYDTDICALGRYHVLIQYQWFIKKPHCVERTGIIGICENAERAALLFVSSVCLGLLIILLAVSTRLTCTRRSHARCCLNKQTTAEELKNDDDDNEDIEDDDHRDDESELLMDSCMLSEIGRKVYSWEEVTYTTEAAELIERVERRELVIQEIRMNAYLNGTSCALY